MPCDPAQPATGSPLAETARNRTPVGPFSTTLSDPPSAAHVQTILDVHNQLLAALVRT